MITQKTFNKHPPCPRFHSGIGNITLNQRLSHTKLLFYLGVGQISVDVNCQAAGGGGGVGGCVRGGGIYKESMCMGRIKQGHTPSLGGQGRPLG